VLHRRYFEEILEEPDSDLGCRYLFDRYPENVRAWQPPSPVFFQDLDTPEDYRACLN
jgi:CTP:molybdopterin cytidylyltransferase MocA